MSGSTSRSRRGSARTAVNEPSGRSATRLVFVVGFVALLVDVFSKRLAVRELTGREPVEIIGDVLQLRLVRNPGAAFGAGASLTPVISVVAIIATAAVVYFAFRVRSRSWAVCSRQDRAW